MLKYFEKRNMPKYLSPVTAVKLLVLFTGEEGGWYREGLNIPLNYEVKEFIIDLYPILHLHIFKH